MSNENRSVNAVNNIPPRSLATDQNDAVFSVVTGAAAVSGDLWTGYAADPSSNKTPPGKIWVEFESLTTDAYFRLARTGTTTTTTSNGSVLKVGVPRVFYLDPTKDLFIDVIATGAGVVKWRKVGPIGERSRH